MNNLKIITSTTRPGRRGIGIAHWVTGLAQQTGKFNVELIDLAEINLPFFDEPNFPRQQQYQHEHTKRWSATINAADAFIIVLAEYNNGFPAPIKNAIDYLFNEWMYKPVSFVSYGGIAGGLRSVQMLKQVVAALHMLILTESVSIPFFNKFFSDTREFKPDETTIKSAQTMIVELDRYCQASKTLRGVK
ncbi:MAG: NADPH-dependent FMN reductase [Candidatus Amoebophilus sp. 36-38]|nr:MAG: NADPH-dependent FMN reductase [Candidatus Amoebophilus sp. 36-38]